MSMPRRKFSATNDYRYGFNGKENDKDISEGGQDYGMRISDNRLGRFLSEDPITKKYPELTPYQFASNTPIQAIDLDGLEAVVKATKPTALDNFFLPNDLMPFAKKADQPALKQVNMQEVLKYSETLLTASGALGFKAAQAMAVRSNYVELCAKLKPIYNNGTYTEKVEASKLRNSYVLEARKLTPEPFLSFAEDLKSGENLPIKPEGRFFRTNPTVNTKMAIVGTCGTMLSLYGGYTSYQNIKNSQDKPAAIVTEASTWSGAIYGGGLGATSFAPGGPWSATVGSLVGSALGAIGGKTLADGFFGNGNNGPQAPWIQNNINVSDKTRVVKQSQQTDMP